MVKRMKRVRVRPYYRSLRQRMGKGRVREHSRTIHESGRGEHFLRSHATVGQETRELQSKLNPQEKEFLRMFGQFFEEDRAVKEQDFSELGRKIANSLTEKGVLVAWGRSLEVGGEGLTYKKGSKFSRELSAGAFW